MVTLKELHNLQDRVVLITGAAGSLGTVFANTLAEIGASLILVDQPSSDVLNTAARIQDKYSRKVWCFECDLEDTNARNDLLMAVNDQVGKLNCLINNAAFTGATDIDGWSCDFEKQTLESWRRAFEVNLTAAFHLSQGFTPLLKVADGANIVNIASIYGEFGPDWRLYEGMLMGNPAGYATSKAGLIQLTRWLATTLAPGVRVNAVCPGGIFRNQPDIFVKRYVDRTPMQRMATENDLIGAIAFLCSDMSSYMTGQTLFIDGGWGVW